MRGDISGFFGGPPQDNDGDGFSDPPRTHRNINRLAMYGYNYMFLSPWSLCVFSESRSFTQAEDSASTVMLSQSQLFTIDDNIGYFMANAPGMWPIIAPHSYYCIVWDGSQGSGNWSRLNDPDPTIEAQIYLDGADGTNYAFTDGHAKHLKAGAAAAGTNYMIVDKNNGGFLVSGAEIIDKEPYIWNLDSNFFCEAASTAFTCGLP
jgi:prepilin-type processing-associated H-X9-DG protein